jgi:restriction system protein
LRQNYRHTKCLSEYLGLDHDLFHSVVIFTGESEFKTPMPANVLDRGLSRYIKSFVERMLTEDQVEEIARTLRSLKESSGFSKSDHLDSLRERHGSTTQCPLCGGSLVRRTAKQCSHAGQEFLGCSNYPRCRYTKGT